MTSGEAAPSGTTDPLAFAAGVPSSGVGWALVAAQGALLAASAGLPAGSDWLRPAWLRRTALLSQIAGLGLAACAALSLGRGLTPLPYPNARAELRTDGPFARVRHPIYSGLLLAVAARAAASGSRRQLVIFAALLGLFRVKTGVEERALHERFADYDEFAATRGRFLPQLSVGHTSSRR